MPAMVDKLRVTLCFFLGGKDCATSEVHQEESLALSKRERRLCFFPARSLTFTRSAKLTTTAASFFSSIIVTFDLSTEGWRLGQMLGWWCPGGLRHSAPWPATSQGVVAGNEHLGAP